MNIVYSGLYLNNSANVRDIHDLNFQITYQKLTSKGSPYNLRLTVHNVVGSRLVAQPSFYGNFSFIQNQQILPFFAIFGFDFKF